MSTSLPLPSMALLCLAGCCYWISGPHSSLLVDLTLDDWELVCERMFGDAEDRVVDCDGTEVLYEVTTVEDCQEEAAGYGAADCIATLDDWVECQESLELDDAQVCGEEEVLESWHCERLDECTDTDE